MPTPAERDETMRKHLALAVSAVTLLIAGPGLTAPPSSDTRSLSVTIYNDDLALVQDRRSIVVKEGRQRIEFQDVSAQIRPETVSLAAPGIGIVEQNFDFDLLTPAKLMEKAVGKTVTIVRVNPATGAETREQAQVLATNQVVVLKIGERIEVLREDGLPVRVIFDKVPENLRAHPTLSVTLEADHEGAKPAVLNYLTKGLAWHADYVALYDETASKLDVQGWVTLTNSSGTSYDNAETILVAGAPNELAPRPNSQEYYQWQQRQQSNGSLRQAGTESGSRERVGDFYLYPLTGRTTISNAQTKQVSFLDVQGVPAEHGYEYRNPWLHTVADPESAKTVYRFATGSRAGLGDQLPAGVLRLYTRDKRGQPQFIGESRIEHTPMGSSVALATGDAFDVKVKPIVEKRENTGINRWSTHMRYVLSNALSKPVTVTLWQDGLWADTTILEESQKSMRLSADVTEWAVQVPANGKTEVTATFETKF
jgi:hypothetical protein